MAKTLSAYTVHRLAEKIALFASRPEGFLLACDGPDEPIVQTDNHRSQRLRISVAFSINIPRYRHSVGSTVTLSRTQRAKRAQRPPDLAFLGGLGHVEVLLSSFG